jgi:hypothetical protein
MKIVYKTVDGRTFEDDGAARAHEEKLFLDWLATNPPVNARDVMESLESYDEDEHYGTQQKIFTNLLRKFWENVICK